MFVSHGKSYNHMYVFTLVARKHRIKFSAPVVTV